MHLLVDLAEVLIVPGRLPTFIVITTVDFALLGLILSEVQALHREHFRTNRQLEILVRYFVVTIEVKLRENLIKLLFRNVHAPELKIKLKLFSANLSRFLDIQIHEGLSESLPLELYLLDDLLFEVSGEQNFLGLILIIFLVPGVLFLVHLILRILLGIVSEIETFRHMDRVT